MEFILENDGVTEETQSNTVASQVEETKETPAEGAQETTSTEQTGAEQAEGKAEGSKQTEATIKIGDREVPLSKAQKALEDYENDNSWKDKNRRESEQLNKERERIRRLELLEPLIQERPEVLQQLLAPKPQRDFDAEMKELYKHRPDGYDPEQMSAWELRRDQLLADKNQSAVESRIQLERAALEADTHNSRVESAAMEKYVKAGKVDEAEFRRMTQWIIDNLKPVNGKAPVDAYETAYYRLFTDKFERDIRADATKRALNPIAKASSGGQDAGLTQRTPPPNPRDKEDDEFVNGVKEQAKGNYMKI